MEDDEDAEDDDMSVDNMPRGKGRIGPYRGERSCGMYTNPTNEENLTKSLVNAIQLNDIATEAPNPTNASCDIANNDPNHTISTPTISQASNDPFDAIANGGRLRIVVVNGLLEPSSKCSGVITKVFKQKVDTNGYIWKTISQATKDFYFEEFRKHCVWDSSMEAQVKVAWVIKASQRYSDFLRDIRNSEKKPEYMSDDVWRHWKASWDKPEFKMKREKNSNNRRSIAGPSSHTGGSISNVEHGKRLYKHLH
ncbi:uncharacterized protein LOC120279379 [Dioscorea cayenensis subsp. rotundata]|uniref:Uncharacterized protein LOC120279379 n=1 Tax=Dioscorea cayennensis subsp. rotundata TaxID=55577 RepID=A0AB40CQF3_DIOCR|nr:uncharacterized protein LOC120279379 [Dioscorea cayenensis subsp. rotundata]